MKRKGNGEHTASTERPSPSSTVQPMCIKSLYIAIQCGASSCRKIAHSLVAKGSSLEKSRCLKVVCLFSFAWTKN